LEDKKIVPSLEAAYSVYVSYCVPKVEEMARGMGRPELGVSREVLIFEREMPYVSRSIHLILVNEALGSNHRRLKSSGFAPVG